MPANSASADFSLPPKDEASSKLPSSSNPNPEYPLPSMPLGFSGSGSGSSSSSKNDIALGTEFFFFSSLDEDSNALKSGMSPRLAPKPAPPKISSSPLAFRSASAFAAASASSCAICSGVFGFSGMPVTKSSLSSTSGMDSGTGKGIAFSPRAARTFISLPNLRTCSLNFFN